MRMETTVDGHAVDPLVFYATSRQPAGRAPMGWRPALLAPYVDLANLRYDFPLVLADKGSPVVSLTDVIDCLLQKIAPPGAPGEKLRQIVLRIEREIRKSAAGGAEGTLTQLWQSAAAKLGETGEAQIAFAALDVDGSVLDCGQATASTLITHLWKVAQGAKATKFHAKAQRLEAALTGILRADYLRSPEGRSAENLRESVGPGHRALIDFEVLATLLPKARDGLPESRRRRIAWALSVLQQQRFFVSTGKPRSQAYQPFDFRFDSCGEALSTHRARSAGMAELVKAMLIAELEIAGVYNETRHDALFADFDAGSLSGDDRAQFPDYLLVLGDDVESFDSTGLLAVLSSGLPFKILANLSDLVAGTPAGNEPWALGVRSADVAGLATGLGSVFVLQSTSSNLYAMRDRLLRGLEFTGPALFSVYSAPLGTALPAYLGAAAAMQSRAFPAFTYDPGAGSDLASRFSLENNPQPEADWARSDLEWADGDLQRITRNIAFTYVDFLASDQRYLNHFALPPAGFNKLAPVSECIENAPARSFVPAVVVSNDADEISHLVADQLAMEAARRCLDSWHRLQELGGVHNSHAERLLVRERKSWEEQYKQVQVVVEPVAAAPAVAPEELRQETQETPTGQAYIETARCSSCNECTQVNNRMFAYNPDKQAYIADPKAGTFAQLVEAAENCQLGIIHPGKPANDGEPGLDDLIKRAEPFQ